MIAALFVQESGIYSTLPDVEIWPERLDARLYRGPFAVVAHPPCQRWGNLGAINYIRHGGVHNRPGNDGGCFASALASVRQWGGVLEHPAGSHAWSTFRLESPTSGRWTRIDMGWTCEVWQSAYGHKANKKTWLYYNGIATPADAKCDRVRASHQVGFQDQRGKDGNKPTLSGREANATPPEFAHYLISLARSARLAAR